MKNIIVGLPFCSQPASQPARDRGRACAGGTGAGYFPLDARALKIRRGAKSGRAHAGFGAEFL